VSEIGDRTCADGNPRRFYEPPQRKESEGREGSGNKEGGQSVEPSGSLNLKGALGSKGLKDDWHSSAPSPPGRLFSPPNPNQHLSIYNM
jgi:hypothetical protein